MHSQNRLSFPKLQLAIYEYNKKQYVKMNGLSSVMNFESHTR